jgi:tRNA(Ile)-lysidine synthetase-like protein
MRLESLDVERVVLTASRHPAAADVARRISNRLAAGSRVLVAFSGGVDSTALAAILLALHRRRRPAVVDPVLGHVDHAIRESSREEAEFVSKVAARLSVPFVHRRLDWPSDVGHVSSLQAREARWNALESMANEIDAVAIVTAHHADDQAETILMRLIRGTGLDGLAGIPECRSVGDGRMLLRPLLQRPRQELAELVDTVGLPWIEDPTNHDRNRTRERLRHDVMPILESLHPGASRHLAALAEERSAAEAATPVIQTNLMDRTLARTWPDAEVVTRLRSMAANLAGPSALAIPRTVWKQAAAMVMDLEDRPRRLRIDPALDVVVHRDLATIETRSVNDDPTTLERPAHP